MRGLLMFPALVSTFVGAIDGGTTVTTSTIMDILTAITAQFSVAQIVAMIAGILGVSMAFVFLWWGVRKGASVVFRAVKSGKFSI